MKTSLALVVLCIYFLQSCNAADDLKDDYTKISLAVRHGQVVLSNAAWSVKNSIENLMNLQAEVIDNEIFHDNDFTREFAKQEADPYWVDADCRRSRVSGHDQYRDEAINNTRQCTEYVMAESRIQALEDDFNSLYNNTSDYFESVDDKIKTCKTVPSSDCVNNLLKDVTEFVLRLMEEIDARNHIAYVIRDALKACVDVGHEFDRNIQPFVNAIKNCRYCGPDYC